MKKDEFRPLPDEFNLGYVPSSKPEEEKKKKKKKRLRKVILTAAAVFLFLPFTLKTGIFKSAEANIIPGHPDGADNGASLHPEGNDAGTNGSEDETSRNDEKNPDGTYFAGTTYVTLDKGRGWYFNGEYFIPLRYDMESLAYRAAGSYPEAETMALDSTVYYTEGEGTIEILAHGVRMFDPFTQETRAFSRIVSEAEIRHISEAFSPVMIENHILGTWTGVFTPEESWPMAYIRDMTLSAGGGLSLTVANTENDETSVYTGSWSLEDGILKTAFDLPLKYQIVTDERTIECSFEQMPEGILIYKESGTFMYLNIFSSQLFAR